MQINEGLYFRSPRLATRFESNVANIAKELVKALLNLIIKFNIQENQVVKNSEDHISPVFSLKIHHQNKKSVAIGPIYYYVSYNQLFGFFPLGLWRRQLRNRQIHRQVCWKRHRISGVAGNERNIGFVGFWNVEPKWCRKVPKMIVLWNLVTKSKLRRVWPFGGIFCLTFFREGCSPAARPDAPPCCKRSFSLSSQEFTTSNLWPYFQIPWRNAWTLNMLAAFRGSTYFSLEKCRWTNSIFEVFAVAMLQ